MRDSDIQSAKTYKARVLAIARGELAKIRDGEIDCYSYTDAMSTFRSEFGQRIDIPAMLAGDPDYDKSKIDDLVAFITRPSEAVEPLSFVTLMEMITAHLIHMDVNSYLSELSKGQNLHVKFDRDNGLLAR